MSLEEAKEESHNLLQEQGFSVSCPELTSSVANAGGGSRTHMGVAPRRILSPLRLPFRHAGAEMLRV
jgi:hypothetical protein